MGALCSVSEVASNRYFDPTSLVQDLLDTGPLHRSY
jgi:hypothetical protein